VPRRDAQRREGRPRNQHRPPSSNRPVRSLRAAACQKVPQGTQRPLRRMQDQAGRTPTCSGSKRATRLRMEAWRKGARRRRRRPEDPRTLKPRRTHDPLTRRGPLMEVAADSSAALEEARSCARRAWPSWAARARPRASLDVDAEAPLAVLRVGPFLLDRAGKLLEVRRRAHRGARSRRRGAQRSCAGSRTIGDDSESTTTP